MQSNRYCRGLPQRHGGLVWPTESRLDTQTVSNVTRSVSLSPYDVNVMSGCSHGGCDGDVDGVWLAICVEITNLLLAI